MERIDTRGHTRAFPEDLLRDASRRLGVASLLAAVLWTAATLLWKVAYHHMYPTDPTWMRVRGTDAIAAVSVLVSLGFFAYSKRGRHEPAFALDLGLVYIVYTAFALALVGHWSAKSAGMSITPAISWAGVVILISAALVPNDKKRVLIAGLIAASMNPLGMLILRAKGGWDFGPASNAFLMHYPDYLLVGAAVVMSNVMTKLGHQVTRAREMGSYELGALLGSGGMGEVYKATHRMLARPAAIKLMRAAAMAGDDGSSELAVMRFRREAEAAARLRSPHTVELYDFGVTDDGTQYFVMELLEGFDLEALVRKHGPVPPNRTVFILRQVCESLAEAHSLGLVHRDIKPANIHVGRLGLQYDFVKVLDFGLVKNIGPATSEEQLLATAAGLTPGTPGFFAPEVALGEHVDGRADLYALGCVAYFLLTGLLVFDGMDAMQMIAKHLRAEPTAPSRRATQHVPASLDRVVLACLAKCPDDRPRDAAELSRMLAAVELEPWTELEARAWWSSRGAPSASD